MRSPKSGPSRPSRGPARPAPGLPTHPQYPLLPPGGAGGGGGSRVRENPTKWRRPLEPRRDRALSRAPAHARASARCLPPLPLAGAGRPILRPHTNGRPRAGAGSCGDGTAERGGSARPQPRLANHHLGRGSRLERQKSSGSHHCLGETVSPGGVSNHHNGSCY